MSTVPLAESPGFMPEGTETIAELDDWLIWSVPVLNAFPGLVAWAEKLAPLPAPVAIGASTVQGRGRVASEFRSCAGSPLEGRGAVDSHTCGPLERLSRA